MAPWQTPKAIRNYLNAGNRALATRNARVKRRSLAGRLRNSHILLQRKEAVAIYFSDPNEKP